MPEYRRARVPGGMYFFTLVTNGRLPLFANQFARDLLGDCFREAQARWPFQITAIVLMPEHLHAIWTLPPGDSNYSARWGWIKKEFTGRWLDGNVSIPEVSPSQARERRQGVWQPRFWEHVIRDEDDFERHFDYIHYNPVKHGHVRCPGEWQPSSFHRWVKAGVYPKNWGCSESVEDVFDFRRIEKTVGE